MVDEHHMAFMRAVPQDMARPQPPPVPAPAPAHQAPQVNPLFPLAPVVYPSPAPPPPFPQEFAPLAHALPPPPIVHAPPPPPPVYAPTPPAVHAPTPRPAPDVVRPIPSDVVSYANEWGILPARRTPGPSPKVFQEGDNGRARAKRVRMKQPGDEQVRLVFVSTHST